MAITKAYLVSIASEFSTVDESRVTALSDIAALSVNASVFGTKADYATALYVAHMLKLDALKGKGAVTKEKLGDMERTYATAKGKNPGALDLTAYGQRFKTLQRSCYKARAFVV